LARRADPVEFEDVTKVPVAVAFGELARPGLKIGRVHFDGRPASATGQVVMVGVHDAASIEVLAAIGHHDVYVARDDEGL
jgi:hypothetical protein